MADKVMMHQSEHSHLVRCSWPGVLLARADKAAALSRVEKWTTETCRHMPPTAFHKHIVRKSVCMDVPWQ
eukprot:106392-Pelagomonas_calceolata.AAC.2